MSKNWKYKKLLWILIPVFLAAVIACVHVFGFVLPRQREQARREQLVQDYTATKLEQYARENARYEDYEVDVAFLGDSLTDGYDVATWYPQYVTVNRGIAGDTTFTLERRLQVSVYDLKPKVAVLLIGGNNPNTMFENYERILRGFQENMPETKVVLVSLISMGDAWAKNNHLAAFNNVKIKKLAEKYGYGYVDLYGPLLDMETDEMYTQYTTDGAHQTPAGYGIFTQYITPELEKLLGY